jgi:hypothetical protein
MSFGSCKTARLSNVETTAREPEEGMAKFLLALIALAFAVLIGVPVFAAFTM